MMTMNTITLGELIDALAKYPADCQIGFDFCGTVPTTFESFRGYYDQLALGWSDRRGVAHVTCGELLALAKEAEGATFTGWKGGRYTMSRDTPVWIDNRGECTDTVIVGLREVNDNEGGDAYFVRICTRHETDA
jgi:hypothetical protein